jgi:hypothetical protein
MARRLLVSWAILSDGAVDHLKTTLTWRGLIQQMVLTKALSSLLFYTDFRTGGLVYVAILPLLDQNQSSWKDAS